MGGGAVGEGGKCPITTFGKKTTTFAFAFVVGTTQNYHFFDVDPKRQDRKSAVVRGEV